MCKPDFTRSWQISLPQGMGSYYKTEIDFLRPEGIGGGAIDQLKANFEVEVNRVILDVGGPRDPALVDLIQQFKDL